MRQTVVELLINYGKKLSKNPKIMSMLAESEEANEFLLDNKNAFFFGVIMNQWIDAKRAWTAPYMLFRRMGKLTPEVISVMEVSDLEEVIKRKNSLHRFPRRIAEFLIESSKLLLEKYDGNAENIWNDTPESNKLYKRLTEFHGIGQKKASMTINILVKQLLVPIKNRTDIDVAYDSHIRRVFFRTGLVEDDTLESVILAARELSPDFPAALDFPAWSIGRNCCFPNSPDCENCPLDLVCAKNIKPDVQQVLLRLRRITNSFERFFEKIKSELWSLELKIDKMTRSKSQLGRIYGYCAVDGKDCKHKGEKGHPIRYLLYTDEGVCHLSKAEKSKVEERIGKRREAGEVERKVFSYMNLLEEFKSLKENAWEG